MTEANVMEIGAAAAALATADRLGIIACLRDGPRTLDSLARELGVDAPMTRVVLEVLETIDMVLFDDTGRCSLGPGLALDIASRLRGPGGMFQHWSRTERLVREGPSAAATPTTEDRNAQYPSVVPTLGQMFAEPARQLASQLAQSAPKAILDVGAGAGVWGLSVLEQLPEAHLTALDLPKVLPRFREAADERRLSSRTATIGGDYFDVAIPDSTFDMVIVGGVLHLETETRARELLARLTPALTPDGALVIADVLRANTPEARRARAAYALHLALRIPGGRPHPEEEVRTWLENLGLNTRQRIDLEGSHRPQISALIATTSF